MKPGKATVATLTNHVLNFETSPRAMRRRSWMLLLKDKVLDAFALANTDTGLAPIDATSLHRLHTGLKAMFVRHRELRRAARRLAKMALAQQEGLDRSHAEHDSLVTRIIKLEAELDRARENAFPEPTPDVIRQDAAWARDFISSVTRAPKNAKTPQRQQLLIELVHKLEALRTGRLARVEAGKYSDHALNYAEQIRALIEDKTIGVAVVLVNDKGNVGIATNVDSKSLARAVGEWSSAGCK